MAIHKNFIFMTVEDGVEVMSIQVQIPFYQSFYTPIEYSLKGKKLDSKRGGAISNAALGHGYGVFIIDGDGVQGEHKQHLIVDEYQGKTLQLEVCEEVLVAVTSENRIRLWRIENSEVKPSGLPSGRKVSSISHFHDAI